MPGEIGWMIPQLHAYRTHWDPAASWGTKPSLFPGSHRGVVMLLRRKPKATVPVVEEALCTNTFRPGAVAVEIQRGDRLPIDDPVVAAHPSYFMGLVSLPLKEVNTNGE